LVLACLLLKPASSIKRVDDWALDVAVPVTVKNYKNVKRAAVVYVYTITRKINRKGLIFAISYFFSNKFKTKSIICFDIGLDNLYHYDCVFDIILKSYFDSFDIDIFLRTMKFEQHNGWKMKEKSTRLYQIISRLIVKNLIEVK